MRFLADENVPGDDAVAELEAAGHGLGSNDRNSPLGGHVYGRSSPMRLPHHRYSARHFLL